MIFDELDTYLREKKKRKNTCPCKSRSREDDRFSSKLRSFRNDKGNCKKIQFGMHADSWESTKEA